MRLNNFVDNFQKDHSKLINLVTSFRKAIESTNHGEAKEILTKDGCYEISIGEAQPVKFVEDSKLFKLGFCLVQV